jgi:acetyl esterase/lipase
MYIINEDMILPELRKKGRSQRNKKKEFSLGKLKLLKFLCKFLKGKHNKNMNYKEVYLKREDGSLLRVCVYSPKERKENVPGILWIHGGGYSIGVPEQDDSYIYNFVKESNCIVVSPDYTLSQDKPYPAAFNDCLQSLEYLNKITNDYSINPNQILIGGDSAGGGLALAVALYSRDHKLVPISTMILIYPMIDDRLTKSSTNNDAPVWDSIQNQGSWKLYLGDLSNKNDIPTYASPARETNYSNLPPLISYVGSIDPFLDETKTLIDNLNKENIPTHYQIYEGCFHGFDIICHKSNISKQARTFLLDNYKYAISNYYTKPYKGDI